MKRCVDPRQVFLASRSAGLGVLSQRVCVCGLLESDVAWQAGDRGCPSCHAVWPERLRDLQKHDMDGKPVYEWVAESIPLEVRRHFEHLVATASRLTQVSDPELRLLADGSWEAHAYVGPEDGDEEGVVGRHEDDPSVAVSRFSSALQERLDAIDRSHTSVDSTLARLRAGDWQVAVHNDYRIAGKARTFWLFTHPSGVWAKGEGATDREALVEAERQAAERLGCGVAVPVEAPGRVRRFFPLPGRTISIGLALPYVVENLELSKALKWSVRVVLKEPHTHSVVCDPADFLETWLERPGFVTFQLFSEGSR